MASDPFDETVHAFDFTVEIQGSPVAGFTDASGLGMDPVDYLWRGVLPFLNAVRKLLGLRPFPTITLKRGIVSASAFADWRRQARDGAPDGLSRELVVAFRDERRRRVRTWRLTNARCRSLDGPALNPEAGWTAVESMELTCEDVEAV